MKILNRSEFYRLINISDRVEPLLIRNNFKWWKKPFFFLLIRLISIFTKSKFHHGIIVFYEKEKPLFIMQSIERGVVAELYEEWKKREDREICSLGIYNLYKICKLRAIFAFGKKYDFFIYLRWIFKFLLKRYEKPQSPFYCFELIAFIFSAKSGFWDAKSLENFFNQKYQKL